MSKIKLKPCPFCSCKNIQFWETDNDTHRFQIVCMQCFNGTDECISEEVAIEKWNRRTPMDNIVEKLEEREKYLENAMKESHENGHRFSEEKAMNERVAIRYAINIVKQEIYNVLE